MKNKSSLACEQAQPKKYVRCPLKTALLYIKGKCGNTYIKERLGKGLHQVVIMPDAACELEVMTSYGRRSSINKAEQKFCGYGHFLKNERGHILIIVKHFIEIQVMNHKTGSVLDQGAPSNRDTGLEYFEQCRDVFLRTEASYNTDAFGKEIDPFLNSCGPSELVLIGHTLPDHGLHYSEFDITGGPASEVPSYPVCSFVCDPIQKRMLGCIGKDYSEAEIIILSRTELPVDEYYRDDRLTPPADEIVNLTKKCLRSSDYSGRIRLRDRIDGKGELKIKLVIPKEEETKRDNKESQRILALFSKENFTLQKKIRLFR